VICAVFLWTASASVLAGVVAVLLSLVYALVRDRQHLQEIQAESRRGANHDEGGVLSPPPSPRAGGKGRLRRGEHLPARELLETSWGVPTEVAVELGGIVELVLESFVMHWYRSISDDGDFPNDLRYALSHVIGELLSRLRSRLHLLAFLVDKGMLAIQLHLHWYQAMRSLAVNRNPGVFPPEGEARGHLLTEQQYRCLLREFQLSRRFHSGVFNVERYQRSVRTEAGGGGGRKGGRTMEEGGGAVEGAGGAGEVKEKEACPLVQLMFMKVRRGAER
jgi:hypothetical protein